MVAQKLQYLRWNNHKKTFWVKTFLPMSRFLNWYRHRGYTHWNLLWLCTVVYHWIKKWDSINLQGSNSLTHKHTHLRDSTAGRICSEAVASPLESCQHCHEQIESSGVGGWTFSIMNLNLVYITRPILWEWRKLAYLRAIGEVDKGIVHLSFQEDFIRMCGNCALF